MDERSGHSFSAVLSEHVDLEHLFENHQRALLSKDVGAALATITTFENALKRHISYEDEVLLPLYASKGAEVEGGNLPIFHAEHRKLREMYVAYLYSAYVCSKPPLCSKLERYGRNCSELEPMAKM